jgi:hypothetical protein
MIKTYVYHSFSLKLGYWKFGYYLVIGDRDSVIFLLQVP